MSWHVHEWSPCVSAWCFTAQSYASTEIFRDRTIEKTWHSTSDTVRLVARRNPWTRICLLNFYNWFRDNASFLPRSHCRHPARLWICSFHCNESVKSWGLPIFFVPPLPGMLIVTMVQTFPAKNTATFAIPWTSHVEQLTVGMFAAKLQTLQLIESGEVM